MEGGMKDKAKEGEWKKSKKTRRKEGRTLRSFPFRRPV